MKRLSSLSCVGLAFGIVLAGASAHATTQTHALACQQTSGGFGAASQTVNGWTNTSSSGTSSFWCGLSADASSSIRQVAITVFDRNPTADVTCEIFGLDSTGFFIYDFVTHSMGSGTAAQVISTASNPPPQAVLNYAVKCTVPASSAGNLSYLTAFKVN